MELKKKIIVVDFNNSTSTRLEHKFNRGDCLNLLSYCVYGASTSGGIPDEPIMMLRIKSSSINETALDSVFQSSSTNDLAAQNGTSLTYPIQITGTNTTQIYNDRNAPFIAITWNNNKDLQLTLQTMSGGTYNFSRAVFEFQITI